MKKNTLRHVLFLFVDISHQICILHSKKKNQTNILCFIHPIYWYILTVLYYILSSLRIIYLSKQIVRFISMERKKNESNLLYQKLIRIKQNKRNIQRTISKPKSNNQIKRWAQSVINNRISVSSFCSAMSMCLPALLVIWNKNTKERTCVGWCNLVPIVFTQNSKFMYKLNETESVIIKRKILIFR